MLAKYQWYSDIFNSCGNIVITVLLKEKNLLKL